MLQVCLPTMEKTVRCEVQSHHASSVFLVVEPSKIIFLI